MTFIRLVNYGKPSYILVFSLKKLQITQKDVLCTTITTIISFTIQDLQTNVSIFKHKRKKKEIKKFIFYVVNVEQFFFFLRK